LLNFKISSETNTTRRLKLVKFGKILHNGDEMSKGLFLFAQESNHPVRSGPPLPARTTDIVQSGGLRKEGIKKPKNLNKFYGN